MWFFTIFCMLAYSNDLLDPGIGFSRKNYVGYRRVKIFFCTKYPLLSRVKRGKKMNFFEKTRFFAIFECLHTRFTIDKCDFAVAYLKVVPSRFIHP